jgi:tRNA nucleotidyltransferase/poly(A) polymerase
MQALLQSLNNSLKTLSQELSQMQHEAAIPICHQHICQLQEIAKNYHFKNQEEEIDFFKHFKPQFVAQLIYYVSVVNIESAKPLDYSKKKKYYRTQIKRINRFINDNIDFYSYMSQQETYLDTVYFLRSPTTLPAQTEPHYYLSDSHFTTSHDYKTAQILANDRLLIFLKQQIAEIKKGSTETQRPTFYWNHSKTDIAELMLALQAIKVLNNEQHQEVEFNEIVQFFVKHFGVEFPNIHKTLIEVKSRHNPAKFLDKLREALLNQIDQELGN